MRRRRAPYLVALGLGGSVALVAGCSHPEPKAAPVPPPTVAAVTTTTIVDLSGIKLSGVAGKTATTLGIGPGKGTLNGTVTGPDGPVGGATVHVERLVGDAVATQDVVSNPDGTYAVLNVLGGRYRLRAYVPDPYDLAQVTPVILFLGGTETKATNLVMTLHSGQTVKASIAPNPPVFGNASNIAVLVTTEVVDDQGVVRGTPVPGAKVELFGSAAWAVDNENPGVTDGNGLVVFRMRCQAPGDQPLSASVNDGAAVDLSIPACVAPPTTTEPTAAPTTVAGAPTTAPSGSTPSTATTTTRPSATTTTAKR